MSLDLHTLTARYSQKQDGDACLAELPTGSILYCVVMGDGTEDEDEKAPESIGRPVITEKLKHAFSSLMSTLYTKMSVADNTYTVTAKTLRGFTSVVAAILHMASLTGNNNSRILHVCKITRPSGMAQHCHWYDFARNDVRAIASYAVDIHKALEIIESGKSVFKLAPALQQVHNVRDQANVRVLYFVGRKQFTDYQAAMREAERSGQTVCVSIDNGENIDCRPRRYESGRAGRLRNRVFISATEQQRPKRRRHPTPSATGPVAKLDGAFLDKHFELILPFSIRLVHVRLIDSNLVRQVMANKLFVSLKSHITNVLRESSEHVCPLVSHYDTSRQGEIVIKIIPTGSPGDLYTYTSDILRYSEPCPDKQFQVYSVGLTVTHATDPQFGGHANMLIIDNYNRTAELIEPHGQYAGDDIPLSDIERSVFVTDRRVRGNINANNAAHVIVEEAIYDIIQIICGPGFTYIPQNQSSLQKMHSRMIKHYGTENYMYSSGYDSCVLMSTLYAFVRVNHPNVPREEIDSKLSAWAKTDDAHNFPYLFMSNIIASMNEDDYRDLERLVHKVGYVVPL